MARDEGDCVIQGTSITITTCRLLFKKVCREVTTMALDRDGSTEAPVDTSLVKEEESQPM